MPNTRKNAGEIHLNELNPLILELVDKAAKKQHKTTHEWVGESLKQAADDVLYPEQAQNFSAVVASLQRIEERLSKLEHSPLHDGAKVLSEGAKAFTESARDIYEKVEARKWFDKSYEAASKVCDNVSEQFKTWWETRSSHKPSADSESPLEGEVIKKEDKNKD